MIGHGIPTHRLAIENPFYPFDRIDGIIKDLGLGVCMDVGHLLVNRVDLAAFYSRYGERVSIIHLHGVDEGRDHVSLDRISPDGFGPILDILRRFGGTVSVEVFSFEDLQTSLQFLDSSRHPSPTHGHSR